MATSTFYENIYIDEKAADILIRGLNGPKPPRPASRKADIEKGEALLARFLSNLETSVPNKEKQQ